MEDIYSHYGKPADVWKHLALCTILKEEHPVTYVETNSACAEYILKGTAEQQYGIYSFIEGAANNHDLLNSPYYKLEYTAVKQGKYIGSPGLAMSTLDGIAERFIFFDIQATPLENISAFAGEHQLSDKVTTIRQDSITGVSDLLSTLPLSTFIHIDPYAIDQVSTNGYDYMDVFVKASAKGLKCFLWYGFNTLNEKSYLNNFISGKLPDSPDTDFFCSELIMDIIRPDSIPCNPGILGSGLLTSNLSETSVLAIRNYARALTKMYSTVMYNGFKGNMYNEEVKV